MPRLCLVASVLFCFINLTVSVEVEERKDDNLAPLERRTDDKEEVAAIKRKVALKDMLGKKDRTMIKAAEGGNSLKNSLKDLVKSDPSAELLKNKKNKKKKNKKNKKSLMPTKLEDIVGIQLDKKKVKKFKLKPSSRRACRADERTGCGEICRCISNKLYCCRQRKDWNSLTTPEKRRYVQVVYDVAMGRRGWALRNRYNRLIYIHERFWFSGIHRRMEFFPWHRIYLSMYEDILREVDCSITVPYWDWTKKVNRWWEADLFEDYFGANIDFRRRQYMDYDSCPTSGVFSEQSGFTDLQRNCLVRKFTYSVSPASYRRIQTILSWSDFSKFETALRHEHGLPHYIVGGQGDGLFFTERAAEDPLFFVHHANVDYQWYQRQTRYMQLRWQFWGEAPQRSYPLTGLNANVGSAVNPFRHGNSDTCVEYIESEDNRYEKLVTERKDVGQLSMECVQDRYRFPDQIFTLFKTSRAEIVQFLSGRNIDGYC